MNTAPAAILVVDDNAVNRQVLTLQLTPKGYVLTEADNGCRALELLAAGNFDLVLLDIMMPEMNGFQVLERLKVDARLRHVPVVVLSTLDDIASIAKCVELGAEDYLLKPVNPTLLHARIGACLEKKRLRDREQQQAKQLQAEQERSEQLLLSILPKPIAERLKQGQRTIAECFPEATIMFADVHDFSRLTAGLAPEKVVELLNQIFSAFDRLAQQHGLEKIKTIGDAYLVAGGIPTPRPDHVEAVAELALAMQREIMQFRTPAGSSFSLRIGIHTGPVVAGVIGITRFAYDLWGETVNTASQMESCGEPGNIQVSEATYQRLREKYFFEDRGEFYIKGVGEVKTYLLKGKKKATPSQEKP